MKLQKPIKAHFWQAISPNAPFLLDSVITIPSLLTYSRKEYLCHYLNQMWVTGPLVSARRACSFCCSQNQLVLLCYLILPLLATSTRAQPEQEKHFKATWKIFVLQLSPGECNGTDQRGQWHYNGWAREPQGRRQAAEGREASLEQRALSKVTARAVLEGSSGSHWSPH